MLSLDYKAPAELFVNNGGRTGRVMTCRRFDQAAEAVRYVKEFLPLANAGSTVMEVDEARYRHADILKLYDSNEYPLPRA